MGVSALGIGMRDGDVLIKVMGAPAISVADVVGRVAAARSRRLPQISGQFWRDGEQWNLIVEQPYMAGSAAP
jgi:S1-C subfamily serine protease